MSEIQIFKNVEELVTLLKEYKKTINKEDFIKKSVFFSEYSGKF